MIWYNPPFSKNVRTNIAHDFLQLIDKHFPPSKRLNTLLNRHTVRVSYSCTENMKAFITRHNKTVLNKQANETQPTKNTDLRHCNCRRADECPTGGKCLQKSVVNKAEVTTADNQEKKVYIGVTANAFKERYRNHRKSFKNWKYANETELSKFVWKLKTANRNFTTKWSILKQIPSCKIGSTRCNLCLEEKLIIMKGRKTNLLNSRSELLTKCRHVTKHHLT